MLHVLVFYKQLLCNCTESVNNNKRPMGHIAHLRKQFKSINTYDYIITLIKRRKKNIIKLMRIYWFFIWRNLNPYHPRTLNCAKIVWNQLSDFFNFVNVFWLFHNYLPFAKGPIEQNWIPFTQGCFVPSLIEIGSVVLEKMMFKFCQSIFAIW